MHFINKKENIAREIMEGFALAHAQSVSLLPNNTLVNKTIANAQRVTIVGVDAVGHEPGMMALVAEGPLDACVLGDVLATAGPQAVLDAIALADRGQGVLLVTLAGNGADLAGNIVLNEAAQRGLKFAHVKVQDDCSFAGAGDDANNAFPRVGGLGVLPVVRAAMQAAQAGLTLAEVAAAAQQVAAHSASLTLVARPAVHPLTQEVLGVHGAGSMALGAELVAVKSADGAAQLLVERLCALLGVATDDAVELYASGGGAAGEAYLMYLSCVQVLAARGIKVAGGAAGTLYAELDAVGMSICLVKV